MKSYKERTLIAWEKLAWKYRHPEGQIFFTPSYCPTCKIYEECIGCPMSKDPNHTTLLMGCLDFKTYENANINYRTIDKVQWLKSFEARAEFFEKTLPMLKEVPAKYFTPTGWTLEAFAFLDRSW